MCLDGVGPADQVFCVLVSTFVRLLFAGQEAKLGVQKGHETVLVVVELQCHAADLLEEPNAVVC